MPAMRKNTLKEKLAAGKRVCGFGLPAPLPALAEIAGLAGFDFLFIDAEHGPLSEADCQALVTAAELRGGTPLVRVRQNEPSLILRYMDTGAAGVIVPGVRSAGEAEQAVAAVKYYPAGSRGLNAVRACDYGMGMPMKEYVAAANRETMVWPIIENAEGVKHAREILAVEGVDGIIIGSGDLAQDLGFPGQAGQPEVQAAIAEIMEAVRQSGKPAGSVVRAGEEPDKYFREGCRMVIVFVYGMLAQAAEAFVRQAKDPMR